MCIYIFLSSLSLAPFQIFSSSHSMLKETTVSHLSMYFCYDAYTFYTLHVSNAYFPKVCTKCIFRPEELLRGPRDIIGASSMGSFLQRHNQHARGRFLCSDAPALPRVGTLTRGSVCLTVGEKKKEIFCTIDKSRRDESRYLRPRVIIRCDETNMYAYIMFYAQVSRFICILPLSTLAHWHTFRGETLME